LQAELSALRKKQAFSPQENPICRDYLLKADLRCLERITNVAPVTDKTLSLARSLSLIHEAMIAKNSTTTSPPVLPVPFFPLALPASLREHAFALSHYFSLFHVCLCGLHADRWTRQAGKVRHYRKKPRLTPACAEAKVHQGRQASDNQ
jgi:hypothetical protein